VHDLRAGRPREHGGRLLRRLHHGPGHLGGRGHRVHRDGLRDRVRDLHRAHVRAAGRDLREASLTPLRVLAVLALVPVLLLGPAQEYIWHVIIQIFLWSFVGNAWSLMGRFGLVSFGHGAFLGVGAYATVLLWNAFGLTPWIGAPLAVALT